MTPWPIACPYGSSLFDNDNTKSPLLHILLDTGRIKVLICIRFMKTSDFDYSLPLELIAQTPIEPRDQSRLMVLNRSNSLIEHRNFFELTNYLRAGDIAI